MGVLFQRQQGPTKINQVQINQSNLGFPVIVLMGRGKVQQSILWLDGYRDKTVSTSGGKGFGGKEGSQFDYSADVLAALCDGGQNGIIGIGDVWSGQSWLKNTDAVEAYTISGSTPSYTPTNAAHMTGDAGVSYTVPLSGTYNDLNADGSTTLAGSMIVPLKRVPYVSGGTLAAGTYSVDSDNKYYFSTANNGTTVQLNYTFALGTITEQVNSLVPGSLQIQVGGSVPFAADKGVIYYNPGSDDPTNGTTLTLVSGSPTAAGTYSVSGSAPATYRFASADIDKEVQITFQLDNSAALPAGTQTSLSFELIPGTPKDEPAALLLTNYPGAAIGYGGIAKVLYSPMDLGFGAQIQQNTFEVYTEDIWGGGITDCSPVQCITQVLTNGAWGLGNGPVPFPVSAIDSVTWGVPTPTGVSQAGSTASNWFAANGFFISPVMDRQDTAASIIGRWLEAGMCAAFISEGLMKLVPYGDTTCAGNGATWVAPSTFDAELTDDDFLVKNANQEPVKITSGNWTEGFNTVQIGWSNRQNQYAPEVTPASDKAFIDRYGSRIEDPQTWDFITTLVAARFAGSMRVKRAVYTRNTYTFSLSYKHGKLEPMSIVSVTTNSAWNADTNNTIQLVRCPVRITKIDDNPDGTYDITAEDLISGAHNPDGFSKGTATPTPPPNKYADPGDTVPVFLDAPLALKIYDGNELWIGAAGSSSAWGGCYVYASTDGTKYQPIGTIPGPSRLGKLAASFPAHSDPDSVDSLVVALQPGSAPLESATDADADNSITLCYVDGEFIAYSTSALTGVDQYTLSGYIRRALMGTSDASHASGSKFLRLDNTIFKYAYDSSWIGKTIYLKFQSFNAFGNSPQDISGLTAYTFTPEGINYPAPPIVTVSQSASAPGSVGAAASNGVTGTSALTSISPIYVTVTWTWPSNYPKPSGFNVALFEGTDPTDTSSYIAPLATVGASALSYTFVVTPNVTMTNVNAAVEAVYA